jgi:APA family basic amino acid/polyamine antiporter
VEGSEQHHHGGARTQNLLVLVKAILLVGFVGVGLTLGARGWPTWTPPHPESTSPLIIAVGAQSWGFILYSGESSFPFGAFAGSLFYIALAFSGWNAAIYAAEEFENPSRTVPRSMIIGTLLVAALYLLVNWIFVANLDPATAFFTVTSENGTLGHAVMARLLGPAAGVAWSAATVLVFLSAMSAMIFLGPRVYAAMAADGFLPGFLRASPEGHPPRAAVLVQGALTLVIIFTQGLRETLGQVGAILVLFAALVTLGLVVARVRGMKPTPSKRAVVAAVVYVVSSAWMFWKGFGDQPRTLLWVGGVAVVGIAAWALSRRRGVAPAA